MKFLVVVIVSLFLVLSSKNFVCADNDVDDDVTSAVRYQRGSSCAVVVTLEQGRQWTLEKRRAADGRGGAVVVTFQSNMQGWTRKNQKGISDSSVADFIAAAGSDYNDQRDNAIHACDRMMQRD